MLPLPKKTTARHWLASVNAMFNKLLWLPSSGQIYKYAMAPIMLANMDRFCIHW